MIDNASISMSHGATIASERAQGVNDNMDSSHYHSFFELYFLESGERYHMMRDQLYHLKAGEFIIFPPRVMHHSFGREDDPFKRILIYFSAEEILSEELAEYFSQDYLVFSTASTERYSIHQIINMICHEYKEPGLCSQEHLHTLLSLLLLTIRRSARKVTKKEDENVLTHIIQYIYDHYQEDISIEDLSRRFFLSPFHLCRKFKQGTGNTIVQYVNTTRILNAQRMMLETTKNFTQISKETGFSSPTHFNRVFKSVTGMTPSENRRANQKEQHIKGPGQRLI